MMSRLTKLSSLFLYFLSTTVLNAAEQSSAHALSSPPVTTGVLIETLLGLILVLSIIAVLAWLLRGTGRFQFSTNSDLKIISSIALGPRERAVLLQVGEKQILVGVTAQQIQTLHTLESNIESNNNNQSTASGFAEKLQKVLQQKGQS